MASEQDEIDNDPVVRLADGYIEMERRALQAEQQLAQAREENERLDKVDWKLAQVLAERDELREKLTLAHFEIGQEREENAAMRALLVEVQEVSSISIDEAGAITLKPQKADMLSVQGVLRKIRAFLAEHPNQTS